MAQAVDYEKLYKLIGYRFKSEKLLKTALTHSSYASEHKLGYERNNERLEFIGDAYVDAVVGAKLFEIMGSAHEGILSRCRVRLIVRGICCLLPGIEGCTENVCIVNKVGRFLEHSRVYIFGEGIDEVMYISSADLMKRNLDRRVELACPVKSGKIRDRIKAIMYDVYCDMQT